MKRSALTAALAVCTQLGAFTAAPAAQAPEGKPAAGVAPNAAIHVEVNEVEVSLVAEDSHTSPIHGLTIDDLVVKVDGQPVPLRALGTDADVPLSVSLLIDVSLSQKGMQSYYAEAVRGLKEQLHEGRDRVSIYTFAGAVRLYCDWEDVGLLNAKEVERLDAKAGTVLRRSHLGLIGGTRLFDAVLEAIGRAKDVKGRKAILILSDGVDEGSTTTSGRALKGAEQANVSISAIEFTPVGASMINPSFVVTKMHDSLSVVSRASGGLFLRAKSGEEKEQMETILRALKEEYLLYFGAPRIAAGPHRLSIDLVHPVSGGTLLYRKQVWFGAAR